MLYYKYVGRAKDGSLKRGRMEGRSKNDVIRKLRDQGISPRAVQETISLIFERDLNVGSNRVKSEDFVIDCRHCGILVGAGITIVDATNILSQQTESKLLKKTLRQVEDDITGGIAF